MDQAMVNIIFGWGRLIAPVPVNRIIIDLATTGEDNIRIRTIRIYKIKGE
jgi:hypothetical protein